MNLPMFPPAAGGAGSGMTPGLQRTIEQAGIMDRLLTGQMTGQGKIGARATGEFGGVLAKLVAGLQGDASADTLNASVGGLEEVWGETFTQLGGAAGLTVDDALAMLPASPQEILQDLRAKAAELAQLLQQASAQQDMPGLHMVLQTVQVIEIRLVQLGAPGLGPDGAALGDFLSALGMPADDAADLAGTLVDALTLLQDLAFGQGHEQPMLYGAQHLQAQYASATVVQVRSTSITTFHAAQTFAEMQQSQPVLDLTSPVLRDQSLLPTAQTAALVQAEALADVRSGGDLHMPTNAGTHTTVALTKSGRNSGEFGAAGLVFPQAKLAPAPAGLSGQVLYQWQQTATGLDVWQGLGADAAQAMEDMSQALEGSLDALLDGSLDARLDAAALPQRGETRAAAAALKFTELLKHAQVGQQIAPQFKAIAEQGGGQMRVTLYPEELGEVTLDLQLRDGRIQGTIAASNPEVLEQLARDLHLLKQGLTTAGFDLGGAGIAFLLQDDTTAGHTDAHSGANGTPAAAGDATELGMEGSTANSNTWLDPNRLLDAVV